MAVTGGSGREAWTSYRTIEKLRGATWVEVTLHTGRTHQIRVHFQFLRVPLVGDTTYGARSNAVLRERTGYVAPRQMLHAQRLAFNHPLTGARMAFESPLPGDFLEALAAMTTEQIVGLVLTLLVMGVGVLGSLLPALPSTPIVLVAAIGHRLYFRDAGASNTVLVILAGVTLFSLLLDFIASMLGAKKLGASWLGVTGAVVGAVVGLFFSLPGLILGPFIGALAFELIGGRNLEDSTRAGVGAVIGLVVGAIGKCACCLVMMAVFAVNVINRSGASAPVEVVASFLSQVLPG
jgi:uncharacterized protein YqgC (DUF456 family)